MFQVSLRPGNNYRIAATTLSHYLNECVAFHKVQTAGVYRNGVLLFDDEKRRLPVKASPALTVWRKLYVEVDSLGVPLQGQQFAGTDLLRNNVPDPPISDNQLLRDAFRVAYDVERHPNPSVHQNNLPWTNPDNPSRYAFPDNNALENNLFAQHFDSRPRDAQSNVRQRSDFWGVYVAGVYEVGLTLAFVEVRGMPLNEPVSGAVDPEQGQEDDSPFRSIRNNADNDPDVETVTMPDGRRGTASALLGWTNAVIGNVQWGPVPAPSVIGMETIRDIAAEHALDQNRVIAFVVAHEFGHKFRAGHTPIYSAASADLMWTPKGNFMEPDLANMRPFFWQDWLREIRRRDPDP